MTIPTLVTALRIVLTPFIVWQICVGNNEWAFFLLVIAGFTDMLDGLLARVLKQPSELGEKLDPIADKALLVSVYLALAVAHAIPFWIAAVVVGRDVIMAAFILYSRSRRLPVRLTPLPVGKMSTFVQILYAGAVLAILAFGGGETFSRNLLDIAVATVTLASGFAYLLEWLKVQGARPKA